VYSWCEIDKTLPFVGAESVAPDSVYDGLNAADIGQRNEYDQFSPYMNTGVHAGKKNGIKFAY
jgi:hypothetical protein